MFFFKALEKVFYVFRDIIWSYPDLFVFDRNSLYNSFNRFYKQTRPYSHIVFFGAIYLAVATGLLINPRAYLPINDTKYIEGAIVGVDENGDLLGLKKVMPLVHTEIQLEKDISELIYESLLKVNQNNEVVLELVEQCNRIDDNGGIIPNEKELCGQVSGSHYIFRLRKGVKWHDGEELTTKDVEATFSLLKKLNKKIETSSNYSSVVANQLDDIKIIDDYTFELKLREIKNSLPTFFESISFKILPAKYLNDINEYTILTSKPTINVLPIGTGPFKYKTTSVDGKTITLSRNEMYYKGIPHLHNIVFRLFPDRESAKQAILNSQIHGIARLDSNTFKELDYLRNYLQIRSNTIYNQYWGLYLNLNKDSGNPILFDSKVRQAISYSIDRGKLLDSILWQGEEAVGTIPKTSFAYNNDLAKLTFNPNLAKSMLKEQGWNLGPEGFLEKEGKILEIEMVYVDNSDRTGLAKSIQEDLQNVGIKLILRPETIKTINDKYLLPDTKSFDVLLYGQTTFIDPDRYELFHSSQIKSPLKTTSDSSGLNITSYVSEKKDSEIEDQELIKVPKVDVLLEDGRSVTDRKERIKIYQELQEILLEDSPVIYLYHPSYSYFVSSRVKGIKLDNINNIEDRFHSVIDWKIEI